jgi:hypothetical protein
MARISKKRCLACDEVPAKKRGLCQKHYEQFRRKRDTLTEEAAKAWEETLISAGKLARNIQGQRQDSDDAFAESFIEFTNKMPNAIRRSVDEDKPEDVAKWTAEAKAESLKRQKKPNGNAKSG